MLKVGIIGGAGYTGGELIRLLLRHPGCELEFVQSKSQQGKKYYDVHDDLMGETEQEFIGDFNAQVDVLFLCMNHGESSKFLQQKKIPEQTKLIDLSQDFRVDNHAEKNFVYGLPELNREVIKNAQNIANPGCFATAIQLALIPLASSKLLQSEVHISAITGSTGAGRDPKLTSHFSWRSSNLSIYQAFRHRHLKEIYKSIKSLQPEWNTQLRFLPFRGDFTRGIFCSAYLNLDLSLIKIKDIFTTYYESHPFVILTTKNPHLKQVINTNKCVIYLEKQGNVLLIISILDNLLKGAVGQAVQNMNLMCGIEETCGLNLKPTAF
jgi:N-acetyl-gamma-glutamyl-phosphate reductase